MAVSVAEALARQHDLFGLIGRAVKNLGKLAEAKRTQAHVNARMDALVSNWKKFQANHEILCGLKEQDKRALPYFTEDLYAQCEEIFLDSWAGMQNQHDALKVAGTPSSQPVANFAPNSRQLPRISLPKFSGTYSEWTSFRDLFASMVVANVEITDVEKLQYLKMSLSGEAAQLIRNISVTGENFARAWESLKSRYDHKRVLVDTHLTALFAARQLSRESASELKSLLGDVKEAIGSLKALGCHTEFWDPILVFMTARKLDSESLKDWEKNIGADSDLVSFGELESFLLGRIRALEAVERMSTQKKPANSRANSAPNSNQQASAKSHQASVKSSLESATPASTGPASQTCSLCSGAHYIATCPDYRSKNPEQCRDIVSQKNLCFNCLGMHQYRNCRSQKRCRTCGQPHHTSIHRPNEASERAPAAPAPRQPSLVTAPAATSQQSQTASASTSQTNHSQISSSHVSLSSTNKHTPVLLATALVHVVSCYGEKIEVRALLDQGSEVSFITESLAHRLNLLRRSASLPIHGIGGQRSSIARGCLALGFYSKTNDSFSCAVNAYILAKLTSYLPTCRVVTTNWPHLHGISLADPQYCSSKNIDLVLGAEVYSRVLEEGIRKGPAGTPIAQQTSLGCILSGSVADKNDSDVSYRAAQGLQCSVDRELNDLLQRFWVQEDTSTSSKTPRTEDETRCEEDFVSSHSRSQDGRYIVRLPVKRPLKDLGDSYNPAVRMLVRQEKRFSADERLRLAYSQFLAEYEALGHMTRVPADQEHPRRVFYLPHHAVVRESSSTTKVRVVFNGSFRTSFGITLNENLHVGPKLQTDLADVLTRWRCYAYAFSADIKQMYRQIQVHPDDWDLQRIVWRDNPAEQPRAYHLTTVTYGLASAPYLAIRTLRQLASDESH